MEGLSLIFGVSDSFFFDRIILLVSLAITEEFILFYFYFYSKDCFGMLVSLTITDEFVLLYFYSKDSFVKVVFYLYSFFTNFDVNIDGDYKNLTELFYCDGLAFWNLFRIYYYLAYNSFSY